MVPLYLGLLAHLAATPAPATAVETQPTAVPQNPHPVIIPQKDWDVLPAWQRDYVRNLIDKPGQRRVAGIQEPAWQKASAGEKWRLVKKNLRGRESQEFQHRFSVLYDIAREFEDRSKQGKDPPSRDRKQAFVKDVRQLPILYPGARPRAEEREAFAALNDFASLYEMEEVYEQTHPADAGEAGRLRRFKDEVKGLPPEEAQRKLAELFEQGQRPSAMAVVTGPPAAASAAPPAVPAPLIISKVPPPLKIVIEARPPESPAARAAWVKGGGADNERAHLDAVVKGLTTKTERAVIQRVADNLEVFEAARAANIQRFDEEIRAVEATLKEGAGPADFSWSLDAAKKDHIARLRVRFDRRLIPARGKSTQEALDKGHKVLTHELSHLGDLTDPAGSLLGYTERKAFLNMAKAYQEEGEPPGKLLESDREDLAGLRADPVRWTTEHLLSPSYIEGGKLWAYITLDDFRDPEASLRWRLQAAYDHIRRELQAAAVSGSGAESVENLAQRLFLDPEAAPILAAVRTDASVPESEKSRRFAERAAALPSYRFWVEQYKDPDAASLRNLEAAHRQYWKDLSELR